MSSTYDGDPTKYPETVTLPDDGDAEDAGTVDVPFEALLDRTAHLRRELAAVGALTFDVEVSLAVSFHVVKYAPAIGYWFALCSSANDLFYETKHVRDWGASAIPAPQLHAAVCGDFAIATDGRVAIVDNYTDAFRVRSAAGVWSEVAGSDTANRPSLIYEPVADRWIAAFQTNTGTGPIAVRTSDNDWVSRVNWTPPTMPATTIVLIATDGAGRVVMQGSTLTGTDAYFSYSDDSGETWSAPTTHALGFTYGVSAHHNMAPVHTELGWVAISAAPTTNTCRVFSSADGITWAVAATLATEAIVSLAAVGHVLLGLTARSTIVHSIDSGVTWRRGEGSFLYGADAAVCVAASPSRFLVGAYHRLFPGVAFGERGDVVT